MRLFVKAADGYFDIWWKHDVFDPGTADLQNFAVLVDAWTRDATIQAEDPPKRPPPPDEDQPAAVKIVAYQIRPSAESGIWRVFRVTDGVIEEAQGAVTLDEAKAFCAVNLGMNLEWIVDGMEARSVPKEVNK